MRNNKIVLLALSAIILICCAYIGIRVGNQSNDTETVRNVKAVSEQSVGVKVETVTEAAVGIVPTASPNKSDKVVGEEKKKEDSKQSPSSICKKNANKGSSNSKDKKKDDNKEISVKPTNKPNSTAKPTEGTCYVTIDLRTVLSHMDKLTDNQKELIPSSGYLVQNLSLTFRDGDTVYSALKKACDLKNIALDVDLSWTGYVKGIGNVYEKDLGANSGWLYSVNGRYPNTGINGYKLSSGDHVAFLYSCQRGDI